MLPDGQPDSFSEDANSQLGGADPDGACYDPGSFGEPFDDPALVDFIGAQPFAFFNLIAPRFLTNHIGVYPSSSSSYGDSRARPSISYARTTASNPAAANTLPALSTSVLATSMDAGAKATAVTNSTIGANGATGAQVKEALDDSGLTATGAGVKVGVLSDSFDDLGGAAADEADGALPPASDIQILSDLSSGGTDEGRAMMQIIHDIAPGASLDFYTADISEQDFADGILALAAAGCKVICDDVSYFDEPFFQNGVVAQAIQQVEAEGVVYTTAAGNDASDGYQAAWNPISASVYGYALTDAESFGGSLLQTITVSASRSDTVPLLLEWNQAYGDATSDLEIVVFRNGQFYGAATNVSSGEPTNPWVDFTFDASGTYQIAIENLSGPDPTLIKEIVDGDGAAVTLSGANSGTVFGHAMTTGAVTAGAVDVADTPAFGETPPVSESFSSSGGGTELLFANDGDALSSPDELDPVALSGVDDISTTVSDLSDFFGTSAATASLAGVAALILSADPRLTSAEIEELMEDTAAPMSNPAVSGAGLAQVDPAVADANVSFLTLGSGQELTVSPGVTAFDDVLDVGGSLYVNGDASDATISGGAAIIGVGGAASGANVTSGVQYVYGDASETTLSSGGVQEVLLGGVANVTTVGGGATLYVYGTATDTTLGGGVEVVVPGGSDSDTTVSAGDQYVYGKATATTLTDGVQDVLAGGSASGTDIDSGAILYDYGTATDATLKGGDEVVAAGGAASGATINDGVQYVYGDASETTVAGGVQDVLSGGSASGTDLRAGGVLYVYGDSSDGTISGGAAIVAPGGAASGADVTSGVQYVYGDASETTLSGDGVQEVLSGGTANGTTIDGGAALYVYGTAMGATLSGGVEVVVSGGSDSDATVSAGDQYVYGEARQTTLTGGVQDVLSGGSASGTLIEAGGILYVYGSATDATLKGGDEVVASGGAASDTTINDGVQYIYGDASEATVAGGVQDVLSGGSASGSDVEDGGSLYVYGDAAAATLNGGSEVIGVGGAAIGTITFVNSGQLTLEQPTEANVFQISGFNAPSDILDLANFLDAPHTTLAFSEAANDAGGMLTINNGSASVDLSLLGQHAAKDFSISSDGYGGTLVFG